MGCGTSKKEREESKQAGGHAGTLIFEGDRMLKKSKQGEIDFFKWLHSSEQSANEASQLRQFAPHYYGTEGREGHTYVVLENLLHKYPNANFMDCKLGKVTWTPHHSEENVKMQQEKNKTTTTGSLGFRISGLVVKDNKGKKVESWAKEEGYFNINSDNIHEQFTKIVTKDGKVQLNVVNDFITKTQSLLGWFRNQKLKHFVASSVFYVAGKDGSNQVRYIDFAHALDANGELDTNVIEGLENVISIWEKVREHNS